MWFPPSDVYPAGVVMDATGKQLSAKAQLRGTYSGFKRHDLAAGIGIEQSRYKFGDATLNYAITDRGVLPAVPGSVKPDRLNVRFSRRILSAYLQDEWLLAPRWRLTLGTRIDDYSDVGAQLNSRLVLVWTPLYEWTVKLLYGEGFRASALIETHRMGIPVYRPNPELDPERLRTLDFHLVYSPSPELKLGLNIFRHETIDWIRLQDRGPFIEPENVGELVGEGFELEADWSITKEWSLRGWYAYQYNTNETTHENAGYLPQHRGFSAVQYQRDKLFLNLQGYVVGDRARIPIDLRSEPDDYVRLNLLGRYDLTQDLSLQLEIRNLLNTNDQEASAGVVALVDYPLPERNYYATIRLQF